MARKIIDPEALQARFPAEDRRARVAWVARALPGFLLHRGVRPDVHGETRAGWPVEGWTVRRQVLTTSDPRCRLDRLLYLQTPQAARGLGLSVLSRELHDGRPTGWREVPLTGSTMAHWDARAEGKISRTDPARFANSAAVIVALYSRLSELSDGVVPPQFITPPPPALLEPPVAA